jgi:hypothetical protein
MTLERQLLDGERIFVIPHFLSDAECDEMIALSERLGYEEAPITTAAGPVMFKGVRDNFRLMHEDAELAQQLFERAAPLLVPRWTDWFLVRFNERFRFYRYDHTQ